VGRVKRRERREEKASEALGKWRVEGEEERARRGEWGVGDYILNPIYAVYLTKPLLKVEMLRRYAPQHDIKTRTV